MSAFFFLPEDRPLSRAPGPSPPSPRAPFRPLSPGICLSPGLPDPPLLDSWILPSKTPSSLPPSLRAPGGGLGLLAWTRGRRRGPVVPHAHGVCLTEEDGQPRVPRRAGLRRRHPVDVLQLLQIQPPGPRGGGHGQEAAGEPGAGGGASWGRRGQPLCWGRGLLGKAESAACWGWGLLIKAGSVALGRCPEHPARESAGLGGVRGPHPRVRFS